MPLPRVYLSPATLCRIRLIGRTQTGDIARVGSGTEDETLASSATGKHSLNVKLRRLA